MELGAKTKIDDLLNQYPFILEFFLSQSPKYRLLKNPVARRTVGKVATLDRVASMGGIDLNQLLTGIAAEIKDKTGEEVAISDDGGGVEAPPSEDREARQEVLKGIIKDLHAGVDMAILKQRFHELVRDVDPTEIAAMEQGLIEEGMPESEIKRLCDVHVEVFKESLAKEEVLQAPAGHPVHTFMLENRALEDILRQMAGVLDKICDSSEEEFFRQYRDEVAQLLKRLWDVHLHYLRKENQLFPVLEEHGITGPSQVMWAIDDDIRNTIKAAREELAASKEREALTTIQYAVKSMGDMIYKEENILFPMAMETLLVADWQKVRQGEEEIGYAWVAPPAQWPAGEAYAPEVKAEAEGLVALNLDTGHLSPEQVNLILTHLPVELSFVDENDEVRYYSQVPDKIFPRSPGVIGRKVQNCHPPASLDKVQQILDQFRAGTKDVADFWIEMKDRFIYIRYFAVRDADRTYRGTLEVVQEATDIRKLSGERRLLDWD